MRQNIIKLALCVCAVLLSMPLVAAQSAARDTQSAAREIPPAQETIIPANEIPLEENNSSGFHNYYGLSNEMLEALEKSFGYVPYERLDNEYKSLRALEKLRQAFEAKGNPQPEMFGEVYLDYSGILVINIVDNDLLLTEEIAEILKGENYYVKSVTYSYAYLKTIQDAMIAQLKENSASLDLLTGFGINEMENRIVVELLGCNEENIALFKETIMDSPALVFRESRGRAVYFLG